ncbi:DUF726 domain-containing protein [Intestinirhabdus alba]|nr:DUF726 domain-containing protein [Intestinirhabdus alba]
MKIFKHVYTSALGKSRDCATEIITLNEHLDGIPVVIAPGFLTERQDDWLNYIAERINAPLIYVKWRSSSVLKLSVSALSTLLTPSSLPRAAMLSTALLPGLNALRMAYFGAAMFSAWSSAAKEATLAGKDLAKVLNDIWDDDDKAIFIGHSLGVRVITEAMRTLNSDNVLTSISIAGAINKEQYDERISQIKSARDIIHTNIFSDNDRILKWLYRIGELNVKKLPVGLVDSDLANVKNIKTHIGHTEYHADESFGKLIVRLHNSALELATA